MSSADIHTLPYIVSQRCEGTAEQRQLSEARFSSLLQLSLDEKIRCEI